MTKSVEDMRATFLTIRADVTEHRSILSGVRAFFVKGCVNGMFEIYDMAGRPFKVARENLTLRSVHSSGGTELPWREVDDYLEVKVDCKWTKSLDLSGKNRLADCSGD